MGNCCAGRQEPPQVQRNNVTRDLERRLSIWQATGIVVLRDAKLKEIPFVVQAVSSSARQLDATNNMLSSLPGYLAGFVQLQRLLLASNHLRALPQHIGDLKQLKVLVVDDNQLSELPESLGGLLQLERLSVQSNTLTRLPSTVGSLKRLLSLSVARNRLSVLPNALAECDSLEELDASQNRLQAIPASFGRLKRLKLLMLEQNDITAAPSELLLSCDALQTLSLHANPITPEILQSTHGFEAFERRRRLKADKVIATGVLLGERAMDEGVSR